MRLRVMIFAAFLLAGLGCSSTNTKSSTGSKAAYGEREQNLTEATAMIRSRVMNDVTYKLHVHLNKDSDEFKGEAQIEFNLTEIPKKLHLDFRGGKIVQYSVNNKDIEKIQHANGELVIPAKLLRLGSNHAVVYYSQKYSRNGRGLYRFKDNEDGRVYLWSQFEAFDANHFLPCFDQPDLKATMRMTVTAPADWQVVTTTIEEQTQVEGERKTWSFAETPRMSTYLFSLHAGPYKMWKSQAGKVPLRLFARQSLAKWVKPEFWFRMTQQGFKYFDAYFAYPYPFKKYDQLIVPDFNSGAMENIAAVTFAERYIVRGEETRENRERIANVLMHEMAHMWFGNLVTMKWWNGLWLNESFATYMAYKALAHGTEFKEAWVSLQNGDKQWAYEEDQRVTTHAINGKVPDIESTFNNFDGITYGKGGASLKQLAFYIGEEKFRDGLRNYFKKYQYQNTTLEDFISSLEEVSKKNLNEWASQWLERKGLDTAQVHFKCTEEGGVNKVTEASLEMMPSKAQAADRVHASRVGLFDKKAGAITIRKSFPVEYKKGRTPLKAMVGEGCPDFVYPNVEDHDYVKVSLDPRSLETVKSELSHFQDTLTRQMVWNNLLDMVKDQKLTLNEYHALVIDNLPKEKDIKIVSEGLYNLPTLVYYLPKSTKAQKEWRSKAVGQLEQMTMSQFKKAPAGTDQQKIWFDALVRITESPKVLEELKDLLKGKKTVSGFILDQDRRWSVITRLNMFSAPEAQELLIKEKKRDNTENGMKSALAAEVAKPDPQQKFSLLNQVVSDKSEMSFSRKRMVARYAFPINQDEFREQYSKEFYQNLLAMVKEGRDSQFLRMYTSLTPTTCDEKSLKEISAFLDQNSNSLVPSVLKPLKISKQEEERCIAIRKVATVKDPSAESH